MKPFLASQTFADACEFTYNQEPPRCSKLAETPIAIFPSLVELLMNQLGYLGCPLCTMWGPVVISGL